MQLLILLVVAYIVLVHTRNHVSLPGRLGAVVGMAGGYVLGCYVEALGLRIWYLPLPLLYGLMLGGFFAGHFHRVFRDTFKK